MAITPKALVEGTQVAATTTTYYTATNVTAQIDHATITNTTAGAITLDVHLVENSGSAGVSNQIIDALSIAANATEILSDIIGHRLGSGATIQASASAATSLTLYVSGLEIS